MARVGRVRNHIRRSTPLKSEPALAVGRRHCSRKVRAHHLNRDSARRSRTVFNSDEPRKVRACGIIAAGW
jgi:hypothetical protein